MSIGFDVGYCTLKII